MTNPSESTADLAVDFNGRELGVTVTFTIAEDGAPLLLIDTGFDEPNAVGMRVRLNDALATAWDDEPAWVWQDVPLSFPNGRPDAFCFEIDPDWIVGYTVTATLLDDQERCILRAVSLRVDHATYISLSGYVLDDEDEPTDRYAILYYSDMTRLEVP